MGHNAELAPLIQTKLHRPRPAGDLIHRSRLLDHLEMRRDRPLTFICAPAGYGKSTVAAQWLDQVSGTVSWLSLDEDDNDLCLFLSYFVTAVRTHYPDACSTTRDLLAASRTLPPPESLSTTLLSEIIELPGKLIFVLDDYHLIENNEIHRLVSMLVKHAPPRLHLVIVSRQDVPFSLARLRASQRITEVRMADLRFTPAEVQHYLDLCLEEELPPQTAEVLAERTEGWPVGLRLACLSLQRRQDTAAFLEAFRGSNHYVMEYLVDEVLAQQSQPVQNFLLYTSILDRFCEPLCDALRDVDAKQLPEWRDWPSNKEILHHLQKSNLFVISLDQEGRWYRYHHLFKDLLFLKLAATKTKRQLADLHSAAGVWLEENDFVEEALRHYLRAHNRAAAASLVGRHRYDMMNQTHWRRLAQWLSQFPPNTLDHYPDLLMLKTWLLFHRADWLNLPAAAQRVEASLGQATLPSGAADFLQGEIDAVNSLLSHAAGDVKSAAAYARQSIQRTPAELWGVRLLARQYLAVAHQMEGDLGAACAVIYAGLEEEPAAPAQRAQFKATLLVTACDIYWMAADLHEMAQAADLCISLSQDTSSPEIRNFGHYHRGKADYHRNDLSAAEAHFSVVVRQPFLNYGECFAFGGFGLALTLQAMGHTAKASEVARSVTRFQLEGGNTYLLPEARAFEAELALMQGRWDAANQWAARFDPTLPSMPIYGFFSPHLTLVKVWLAQDTATSRKQARGLLEKMETFVESTHNVRFLVEVLALQAVLYDAQGARGPALNLLRRGVELAQPGGFIRLFVDLGPRVAHLLTALNARCTGSQRPAVRQYIGQILTAYQSEIDPKTRDTQPLAPALLEPLTRREQEVLALLARHLTNKEIAERLVIAPTTVRQHTIHIYQKLAVSGRKQAVGKAQTLGLL